jgi:hypothetical protein
MKGYRKAGEKQVHGEMEDYRKYLGQKGHLVEVCVAELEQADAYAMSRDSGRIDVSACPLLKHRGHHCRCEAEYKAYQPH